jgi:hypothetical protein
VACLEQRVRAIFINTDLTRATLPRDRTMPSGW